MSSTIDPGRNPVLCSKIGCTLSALMSLKCTSSTSATAFLMASSKMLDPLSASAERPVKVKTTDVVSLKWLLGATVPRTVGHCVGPVVGAVVFIAVGAAVGVFVGRTVGRAEGLFVGSAEGAALGAIVLVDTPTKAKSSALRSPL